MANDPRFPAAVSENMVRAFRKVAEDEDNPLLRFKPITRSEVLWLLRAVADEMEKGGDD